MSERACQSVRVRACVSERACQSVSVFTRTRTVKSGGSGGVKKVKLW